MKRKSSFCLGILGVLLLGSGTMVWALLCNDYRRPNPLMDFVPQNQGMYDTTYNNLTDADCRICHGDLTGDLHRLTGPGLANECSLPECHETTPNPGTQGNCVTPSCHGLSGEPIPEDQKRHHASDLAESGQCTACHRPDMVGGVRGEGPLVYYPDDPAPTPFRCNNCHWPDSTKLTPNIEQSINLHHMNWVGSTSYNCWDCHSMATPDASYDPYDPLLIRFCQNCHTAAILHSIHEGDTYGWEAIGFHVPPGNDDCTDLEPNAYRLFTSAEKCVACHGRMPSGQPVLAPEMPAIDNISPHSGDGHTIQIFGTNFGSPGPEASVIFTPRVGNTSSPVIIPSTDLSVSAWTNGYIYVNLYGYGSAPAGNYDTHVQTAAGVSNRALFTLTGTGIAPAVPSTPVITAISPTIGTGGALVTIQGSNFGDRHCCDREIYFQPAGTTTDIASVVYSWTDTEVVVRLRTWVFVPGLYHVRVYNESGDSNVLEFVIREAPGETNLTRNDLDLTIYGSGYGNLQSQVLGDKYGYSSQVKIGNRSHTYTATNITSWIDTQINLALDSFVDETGSPVTQLLGDYGLLVETTYFYDTNSNGQLDPGDQVYHTVTSTLAELELPLVQGELVPDATIIPRGGTLSFGITVTNNTDEVQRFKWATRLTIPNGSKWPPNDYLIGPHINGLNPHASKSGHKSHTIPNGAPLGSYTYHFYLGRPAEGILHECTFDFTVTE